MRIIKLLQVFCFPPAPLLTLTLSTLKKVFFGQFVFYAIYYRAHGFTFRILAVPLGLQSLDSVASRVTYACKNKRYFEILRSSRLHLWAEKFWKTRARFARRSLRSLASFPKICSSHKLGARLAKS